MFRRGIGLFLSATPRLRPIRSALVHLILYTMTGIGVARLLGFVMDGSPDTRQWIWIIAEIAIVVACLLILRRPSASPKS